MISDERKYELRLLAMKLAGQLPLSLEECEYVLRHLRVQIHITFHDKIPNHTDEHRQGAPVSDLDEHRAAEPPNHKDDF